MKTIPLAEAKARFSGLIDEVVRRDERVTITKRGRPAAVLMSHDEAEGLEATLEIMADPEFYAEILRNMRRLERGEGRWYTLDELFGTEGVPSGTRSTRRRSSRSARDRARPRSGPKEEGPRGARGAAKRSRPR